MRAILTAIALLITLPTHLLAATDREIINQILEPYNLECSAEIGNVEPGDVISEIVPVTVSDESIYEINITAGGKKATVLFADFTCPGRGAFWCGSSGCSVYIIVDGVIHYKNRGFKPFSVAEDDEVFVMLPKSGSNCGKSNASPCYRITIWDVEDIEFNIVGRQ